MTVYEPTVVIIMMIIIPMTMFIVMAEPFESSLGSRHKWWPPTFGPSQLA